MKSIFGIILLLLVAVAGSLFARGPTVNGFMNAEMEKPAFVASVSESCDAIALDGSIVISARGSGYFSESANLELVVRLSEDSNLSAYRTKDFPLILHRFKWNC